MNAWKVPALIAGATLFLACATQTDEAHRADVEAVCDAVRVCLPRVDHAACVARVGEIPPERFHPCAACIAELGACGTCETECDLEAADPRSRDASR